MLGWNGIVSQNMLLVHILMNSSTAYGIGSRGLFGMVNGVINCHFNAIVILTL